MSKILKLCTLIILLCSLMWAGPANKCSNSTGSTGITSISCTITGTSSNHLLVLMLTGAQSSASNLPMFGALTFSDGFNLVWKPVVSGGWGNGNIPQQNGLEMMFYSNTGTNSGSDTITVTLGSTVKYVAMYVAEYANNYLQDPNHTVAFIAAGSAGTTQGIQVTQDNEILISLGMCDSGLSLNDVNWTTEGTNGNNCGQYADRTLGAGTAGNSYTVTYTLGDEQEVLVAAFGPAPPANVTHLVQQCNISNYETGSISSYSCTLSGVGANHLLVYVWGSAGRISTVGDTFGLTWANNAVVNSQQLAIGYAITGTHSGSDTLTITTTAAATLTDLYFMEYGGGSWTGIVFDANNSATGGSGTIGTNISTGNITTTKASDLLITAATCVSSGAPSSSGTGVYSLNSSTFVREGWEASNANTTSANCTQWADSISGSTGTYNANWRPNASIPNGTSNGNGPFGSTNFAFMISAFFPSTNSTTQPWFGPLN